MFTEGWVEFKDRRIAKAVARSLNGQILGGKKRGYYHDDLWNIKYLRKFKWGHISEKLAYEKAAREQKMRTEISQAKKEANFYIENVEKSKVIDAIEKRKGKKHKMVDSQSELNKNLKAAKVVNKEFRQRKVVRDAERKTMAGKSQSISSSVLSKVF